MTLTNIPANIHRLLKKLKNLHSSFKSLRVLLHLNTCTLAACCCNIFTDNWNKAKHATDVLVLRASWHQIHMLLHTMLAPTQQIKLYTCIYPYKSPV